MSKPTNTAALAAETIARMAAMTNDERIEVLIAIREAYCDHCGREQDRDGIPCQCWNDD